MTRYVLHVDREPPAPWLLSYTESGVEVLDMESDERRRLLQWLMDREFAFSRELRHAERLRHIRSGHLFSLMATHAAHEHMLTTRVERWMR